MAAQPSADAIHVPASAGEPAVIDAVANLNPADGDAWPDSAVVGRPNALPAVVPWKTKISRVAVTDPGVMQREKLS